MEIDKLKIQINPLAIDFRYVKYLKGHSKNGSYNGRMTGIVPDKPITKRILKENFTGFRRTRVINKTA